MISEISERYEKFRKKIGEPYPIKLEQPLITKDLPFNIHAVEVIDRRIDSDLVGKLPFIALRYREFIAKEKGYIFKNELFSFVEPIVPKKLLMTNMEDEYIKGLTYNLPEFLNNFRKDHFDIVMVPNFSVYDHAKRYIHFENRNISRWFLEQLFRHGIPGVLSYYFYEEERDVEWLSELLSMSDSITHLIGTFHRRGYNSASHIIWELELFKRVEENVGREICFIFKGIELNGRVIKKAVGIFGSPRFTILGEKALRLAIGGKLIYFDPEYMKFFEYDTSSLELLPEKWLLFDLNREIIENAHHFIIYGKPFRTELFDLKWLFKEIKKRSSLLNNQGAHNLENRSQKAFVFAESASDERS